MSKVLRQMLHRSGHAHAVAVGVGRIAREYKQITSAYMLRILPQDK